MINYGSAPAIDELEITIFGPGFGEAVAIHLGENSWLLVDSCINPENNEPATRHYLDSIGVADPSVKVIVASHWHDDHVRGLSELANRYPSAEFYYSSVFNEKECLAFLKAYSGDDSLQLSKGTQELAAVLETHTSRCFPAHHKVVVFEANIAGRSVIVRAFSPTPAAARQCIAHFAQYVPKAAGVDPRNHAPDVQPNAESVVLHIEFGDDAILLGSDLEDQGERGWQMLTESSYCLSKQKASAYKVAHHGSKSGDHTNIWSNLLIGAPHAVMTPFHWGGNRLPTDLDRARIQGYTSKAHISSNGTSRPTLSGDQLKTASRLCNKLVRRNPAFGAVRLRRKPGDIDWSVELFGHASKL